MTVGVNVLETKLVVFMLSAGIAGFAGAFLAQYYGTLNQAQFPMLGRAPDRARARDRRRRRPSRARCSRASSGSASSSSRRRWHISLLRAIEFLAPGLAVLGIIQNPSGAVVPIGEGFAPLLPWRKDAKAEAEEMKAALAEPEVGELGLDRPFTEADVILVDRGLGDHQRRPAADGAGAIGEADHDGARSRSTTVSVPFGGLLAVDDASLEVEAGQVTGLIGPNGAGKTTLFNVITGLQTPTSGGVLLDGGDVTRAKRHARARLGIARTFQRLEAFGSLTARENVLVALEMRRRWATERYDPGEVADELLERVGISAVAEPQVDSLPDRNRAARRARARARHRAAGAAARRAVVGSRRGGDRRARACCCSSSPPDGLGVLLVEHDMSFVMGACAYINVLDFGRIIAHGHPDRDPGRPGGAARRTSAPPRDGVMTDRRRPARPTTRHRREPPVLELAAVRAGYGRIDVLHGVDLTLAAGRGLRAARPERRGQVDDARGRVGSDRAELGEPARCAAATSPA